MSLFVGIDIGTQGIRLLAYDPTRRRDGQRPATPRPEQLEAYRAHYQRFLRHLDAVTPLYT